MPNLTTPFLRLNGDTEQDLKQIEKWSVALIDELKNLLCNLDGGNVIEASSVKAQNIDCTSAKIKDAQVQSMTADKLTAGTIDTEEITVSGSSDDGSMTMTGEQIAFYQNGYSRPRIFIGLDKSSGEYEFIIQSFNKGNNNETTGIYMDDDGEVYMTGALKTSKDCFIQGELRIGLGGNNQKGLKFYGDGYFYNPKTGNWSDEYASIIPYTDQYDDHLKGIEVEKGNLWINNNGTPELVATQPYLKRQLANIEARLSAIEDALFPSTEPGM